MGYIEVERDLARTGLAAESENMLKLDNDLESCDYYTHYKVLVRHQSWHPKSLCQDMQLYLTAPSIHRMSTILYSERLRQTLDQKHKTHPSSVVDQVLLYLSHLTAEATSAPVANPWERQHPSWAKILELIRLIYDNIVNMIIALKIMIRTWRRQRRGTLHGGCLSSCISHR